MALGDSRDSTPTPNLTPIVAGVTSATAAAALFALGLCLRKRQIAKNGRSGQTPLPVAVFDASNAPRPPAHSQSPPSPLYPHTLVLAAGRDGGSRRVVSPSPATITGNVKAKTDPTMHAGKDGGGYAAFAEGLSEDGPTNLASAVATSTSNASTGERDEINQAYRENVIPGAVLVDDNPESTLDEIGTLSSTGRRGSSSGIGLGHAVVEAAQDLARNCHIPGVTEVATVVSILANLVMDNRHHTKGTYASLKRCQSIVMLLQRAAKVLGRVSRRCVMRVHPVFVPGLIFFGYLFELIHVYTVVIYPTVDMFSYLGLMSFRDGLFPTFYRLSSRIPLQHLLCCDYIFASQATVRERCVWAPSFLADIGPPTRN